jgi:MFS superfamily sulfate permease-like transporter
MGTSRITLSRSLCISSPLTLFLQMPLIVYFFFGSSKQLAIGPDAVSSLLVRSYRQTAERCFNVQFFSVFRTNGSAGGFGSGQRDQSRSGGPGCSSASLYGTNFLFTVAATSPLPSSSATSISWPGFHVCLFQQSGLMLFAMGLFRFGFLDVILSRPLLSGFVNALALYLVTEQGSLHHLLYYANCPSIG